MSDAISLEAALSALRPGVDRHVTSERVRRYLSALVDRPAPSTAAGAMRVPVLNQLLAADSAFDSGRLGSIRISAASEVQSFSPAAPAS